MYRDGIFYKQSQNPANDHKWFYYIQSTRVPCSAFSPNQIISNKTCKNSIKY